MHVCVGRLLFVFASVFVFVFLCSVSFFSEWPEYLALHSGPFAEAQKNCIYIYIHTMMYKPMGELENFLASLFPDLEVFLPWWLPSVI